MYFKDLIGERFGRLLVISQAERIRNLISWRCQCDCGNYVTKITNAIKAAPHCGCQTNINLSVAVRESLSKDLTGLKFGKLTALHIVENCKKGKVCWNCLCQCGNYIIVPAVYLTRNNRGVKSCGCSRQTHGLRHTKENEAWRQMKARCLNPNRKGYHNYGGRGIKVCKRWLESFENFYKDMGQAPTKEHSLERIDVNGNYCPENCVWLERNLQNRNVRHNVFKEEDIKLIRTLVDLQCSDKHIRSIFSLLGFTCSRSAFYSVIKNKTWIGIVSYNKDECGYFKAKKLIEESVS